MHFKLAPLARHRWLPSISVIGRDGTACGDAIELISPGSTSLALHYPGPGSIPGVGAYHPLPLSLRTLPSSCDVLSFLRDIASLSKFLASCSHSWTLRSCRPFAWSTPSLRVTHPDRPSAPQVRPLLSRPPGWPQLPWPLDWSLTVATYRLCDKDAPWAWSAATKPRVRTARTAPCDSGAGSLARHACAST